MIRSDIIIGIDKHTGIIQSLLRHAARQPAFNGVLFMYLDARFVCRKYARPAAGQTTSARKSLRFPDWSLLTFGWNALDSPRTNNRFELNLDGFPFRSSN